MIRLQLEITADELNTLTSAIHNFNEVMTERRKECGFNRSDLQRRSQISLRQCELNSVRCKLESAKQRRRN